MGRKVRAVAEERHLMGWARGGVGCRASGAIVSLVGMKKGAGERRREGVTLSMMPFEQKRVTCFWRVVGSSCRILASLMP